MLGCVCITFLAAIQGSFPLPSSKSHGIQTILARYSTEIEVFSGLRVKWKDLLYELEFSEKVQ